MQAARPAWWAIVHRQSYADFVQLASFLEHRGSLEYLARRIEYFERELDRMRMSGEPVGPYITRHMQHVRATQSASRSHSSAQIDHPLPTLDSLLADRTDDAAMIAKRAALADKPTGAAGMDPG
jgi:hypothetical protein